MISEEKRDTVLTLFFGYNWHVAMVANHCDLSLLEVTGIILEVLPPVVETAFPPSNVHQMEIFRYADGPRRSELAA